MSTISTNTVITQADVADKLWPITITGSTTITFGSNLVFDASYYYFIIRSNVIIDGAGYTVEINNCLNYSGLVSNSSYSNTTVQNINIITHGTTTLVAGSGWIGQSAYASIDGASNNIIQNCSSTGSINGNACGGIVGTFSCASTSELSNITCDLTIKNCWTSGAISVQGAGGIVGAKCGYSSANAVISVINCFSTGDISGSRSGGIYGAFCGSAISGSGNGGKAYATNCYSIGTIKLISGNQPGGIYGYNSGTFGGTIFAQNCYVVGSPNNTKLNNNYVPGIFGTDQTTLKQSTCFVEDNTKTWNPTNALATLTGVGTGTWDTNSTAPYNYTLSVFDPPTITGFSISQKQNSDPPFTITDPSSNSDGAFTYTSSNLTVATIDGNIITIIADGTSTITARQSPAGNYGTGTATTVFTVGGSVNTSPTLGSFTIPSKQYGDASFTITAPSSNSDGAFTYTSSNSNIATVSGDVITVVDIGTTTITATQAANGSFLAGTIDASFTVNYITQITTNKTLTPILDSKAHWPLTISGGVSGNPVILTLGNNFIFTDVSHYFIIGSNYITVDGCGNTVDISGVPNYPGLVKNGADGTYGYSNTTIQNVDVITSGNTTLAEHQGWIGQQYYSNNASGNIIQNCYSSGVIGNNFCGGIVGRYAGQLSGGNIDISNCHTTGEISGISAGGIFGPNSGYSYGTARATNCSTSGDITGSDTGGIFGPGAGSTNGRATSTNCHTTGEISSIGCGGIFGSNAGDTYGTATSTNCYTLGDITGLGCGGIFAVFAGGYNGTATASNCYTTGAIIGDSVGGIFGSNAGDTHATATASNCYTTGEIHGINCGGIFGSHASTDNTGSSTANNCFVIGNINTENHCGGIFGLEPGSTVFANNCFVVSTINSKDQFDNYVPGIFASSPGRNDQSNCIVKSYWNGEEASNTLQYDVSPSTWSPQTDPLGQPAFYKLTSNPDSLPRIITYVSSSITIDNTISNYPINWPLFVADEGQKPVNLTFNGSIQLTPSSTKYFITNGQTVSLISNSQTGASITNTDTTANSLFRG